LVSLHGHIHEGRGVTKLGQSTVVNPGSEYDQASLLGVIVEVKPGRVKRCQLVAG
jgi:Icc-related predicted phosphoesterase